MAKPKTNWSAWLGPPSKARNSIELVVLRSTTRSVFAGVAIVAATALMWSDTAISWWTNIIEFALRVNESAFTRVLDNRPSGDADLHALVWGACALLVVSAVKAPFVRYALALLFMWSVFVELAQPWFTELRSRQELDLIGNCVGVLLVIVASEVIAKVRARQ
jgi:hypothetical protein